MNLRQALAPVILFSAPAGRLISVSTLLLLL